MHPGDFVPDGSAAGGAYAGDKPQKTATSTGTAVKASIAKPRGAQKMLLVVRTNPARINFNGGDPTAGADVTIFPTGVTPVWLPARDINFVSDQAAAASSVDVIYAM